MAKKSPKPPRSAKALLRRYAAGERGFPRASLLNVDFRGANLRDVCLEGANLHGADFTAADLAKAILIRTDLRSANLRGADLEGANFRGADLRGANLTGADLRSADLTGANLHGADLEGANLEGANLSGVDLIRANFSSANLSRANLSRANLIRADLTGANLTGAKLGDANLSSADLRGANLSSADLRSADLTGANLTGAKLCNAHFGETHLLNLDMSAICDAGPPVVHHEASSVDFRSIIKSLRSPKLGDFLIRTGIPELAAENMVDSAMALSSNVFDLMRSTFISYGHADEAFARRLYEALLRNGVRVFFAPEHSTPGQKLHRELRKGIENHDRTILVCSQASLDRPWVLYEIEATLERESRDGGASYLIPIRLDGYIFEGWKPDRPDLARAVRERVVADFEGADRDEEAFSRGLRRLLGALRKTPERLAGMEP